MLFVVVGYHPVTFEVFGVQVSLSIEELDRVVVQHAAIHVNVAPGTATGREKERDRHGNAHRVGHAHSRGVLVGKNFREMRGNIGSHEIHVPKSIAGFLLLNLVKCHVGVAGLFSNQVPDPLPEIIALVPAELRQQAIDVPEQSEVFVHEFFKIHLVEDLSGFGRTVV